MITTAPDRTTPDTHPSGVATVLICLGLGVVMLSVLQRFVVPFFWQRETPRIQAWLGVLDHLLTAAALLGFFLWTRSRLWLAAAIVMAVTFGVAAIFWASPGSANLRLTPLAYLSIFCGQVAYLLFGIVLLIRRADSQPGFSVTAGVVSIVITVLSILLWTAFILRFELRVGGGGGRHSPLWQFIQFVDFVHAGGVTAVNGLFMGIFAVVLVRRWKSSSTALGPSGTSAMLRLGAVGALLLAAAWSGIYREVMQILIRPHGHPTEPAELLAFAGLYFLGTVLLGVGYVGQSRLSGGPLGWVAAISLWLLPVVTFVVLLGGSGGGELLVWAHIFLCQLLGAVSFFLCSRAVAAQGGTKLGYGRPLALATSILLCLATLGSLMAPLLLSGTLPRLSLHGTPNQLTVKLVFAILGLLHLAAYLSAALYQLNLGDRVRPAPP